MLFTYLNSILTVISKLYYLNKFISRKTYWNMNLHGCEQTYETDCKCRLDRSYKIILFRCFKVRKDFWATRWRRKPYFIKIVFTVSRHTCTFSWMLKLLVVFLTDMALFLNHMRWIILCKFRWSSTAFLIFNQAICVIFFDKFLNPMRWHYDYMSTLHNWNRFLNI